MFARKKSISVFVPFSVISTGGATLVVSSQFALIFCMQYTEQDSYIEMVALIIPVNFYSSG